MKLLVVAVVLAGCGGGGASPNVDAAADSEATTCGNGDIDSDETCDTGFTSGTGACPTTCSDGDTCTTDALVNPATCKASCSFLAITAPTNGDGCCPSGAIGSNDDDCPPTRVDVTTNKTTISTELNTTHLIDVTIAASNGFAGNVTLAASLLDASDGAFTGWTIALDQTSFTLPTNGTATAHATLTIPSRDLGLFAKAKFVATSSAMAGTGMVLSEITALDQVTFDVGVTGGQCVYPAAGTVTVTVGTKVRWFNTSAADAMNLHVDPNVAGMAHQNVGTFTTPNSAYEQTPTGPSSTAFIWNCHSPGPDAMDRLLSVVN